MSELAQRITTSHKEAAKRAAAYLQRTRKVKLQVAESLELVACVLGVANWQTLLAMAQENRGPRISDGTEGDSLEKSVPEKTAAHMLADLYGTDTSWGESPEYPRDGWEEEVANGDTGLSYWDYVVSQIEQNNGMFPWERDASLKVSEAVGSGWTVGINRIHDSWFLFKNGVKDLTIDGCCSEAEAWDQAVEESRR